MPNYKYLGTADYASFPASDFTRHGVSGQASVTFYGKGDVKTLTTAAFNLLVASGYSLEATADPVQPGAYRAPGGCICMETAFPPPSGLTSPQTFNYTGAEQTMVVPPGVTSVTIDCQGAQGGGNGASEGKGDRTQATLVVTPGETLRVNVGQKPTTNVGGWNGGGTGGTIASGGGGASDVRQGGAALANRKVVAGAGGGMSGLSGAAGGHGGGTTGADGVDGTNADTRGRGGTAAAGGAAGINGTAGSAGASGQGGAGGSSSGYSDGGGGGGGYFGGGGGAAGATDGEEVFFVGGGGGGGSSFTGVGTSAVTHTQGHRAGHGTVVISWV